jgi:O-antigen polymerase
MPIQAYADRNFGAGTLPLRSVLLFSMPLAILLYCASFNWSYARWVSPTWSYMGLTYHAPDSALLAVGYVLAAVQCALSPRRVRRTSQVIYWILYFNVYIPGLFVPLYVQLDASSTLFLLQLSLTSGMLLIALSYRIKLARFRRYCVNPGLFWSLFALVYLVSNAALFVAFRHNLHFSSLNEVYASRFQASAILRESVALTYVSSVLSNVMNPLLIAYGLGVGRYPLVALGVLGQVFVYSTAAMKSVLLSPLLIIVFYYSLKHDRGGWAPKVALTCASTFVVLTALVIGARPGLLFNLASSTLMRSFALPGLAVAQYQYFFEHFPHTHLGHVHGVNLLLGDPYQMPLGLEIGNFYSDVVGGRIQDANANFFAFDGIAGFGLPGIPMMGLLCAAMFWVLDCCARRDVIAISASALTMCMVSLANISLFSAFLGGGFMLWMLLFTYMPRNLFSRNPRDKS